MENDAKCSYDQLERMMRDWFNVTTRGHCVGEMQQSIIYSDKNAGGP